MNDFLRLMFHLKHKQSLITRDIFEHVEGYCHSLPAIYVALYIMIKHFFD